MLKNILKMTLHVYLDISATAKHGKHTTVICIFEHVFGDLNA